MEKGPLENKTLQELIDLKTGDIVTFFGTKLEVRVAERFNGLFASKMPDWIYFSEIVDPKQRPINLLRVKSSGYASGTPEEWYGILQSKTQLVISA